MQLPDTLGVDLLLNKKKVSGDAASIISSVSRSSSSKKDKKSSKKSSSSSSSASLSYGGQDVPKRKSSGSSTSSSSVSGSSYTSSDTGSSMSDTESTMTTDSSRSRRPMSQEDIMNAKREILYQFDRMERRGVKVPKKFTLTSSLEEMKLEYERLRTDREVEGSIRFQRQMLMTFVTGIEFMNNKFDPFDIKLDGWSENVNEQIGSYDDIFEELYHKYKGKAKMPPELRLLFSLGGSAVMFHFTNTMMKYGIENAMKENPELVKQFASATVNSMKAGAPSKASGGGGGLFGGLGSMLGGIGGLGSLFGMGGGGMPSMPQNYAPPPPERTQMRGPSNVDDILRELSNPVPPQQPMTQSVPQTIVIEPKVEDRIEVLSTMSESEISEIPEDASMSGVFPKKRGGSKPPGRRTLNI